MRTTILLLFLFIFSALSAQKIDVRVVNPIHDFGYIKEADGKVTAVFEFQNHSTQPVKVSKTVSTCGCAVINAPKEPQLPGNNFQIHVVYDPTGRPGKFIKSFEIYFSMDSISQPVFLNIKGYTIEKELLEAYVDNLYEGTKLQIKPFSTNVISSTDLRYLSSQELQHFINDITYEIDENGFCNVELSFIAKEIKNDCDIIKTIYPSIHKFIVAELKRRNYQEWQVGFTDIPCVKKLKNTPEIGGVLKISSFKFNNDSIAESGFYPVKSESSDLLKNFNRKQDSISYQKNELYQLMIFKIKDLNEEKNVRYNEYLKLGSRKLLLYGQIQTGFEIQVKCRKESQEKVKIEIFKSLKPYYEKIKEDLEEYGSNPDKIEFTLPNILFQFDSTMSFKKHEIKSTKLTLFHLQLKEDVDNSFKKFIQQDSTQKYLLKDFLTQSGFSKPRQNLPVFQEGTLNLKPDTSSLFYRSWVQIIKDELKNGKKIKLVIESSIGNTPVDKSDNLNFKARQQAKKCLELLENELKDYLNIDSLLEITIEATVVNGINYNSKDYDIANNSNFNYVKFIPIYKNTEAKKNILIPYQVHFNNNQFTLDPSSIVFQNFISRLIPELESNGFVSLTLESCSSKIPSTIYKNNELLSYFRANEATKTIREEVRKRGYDPSRLVFTETRILVNGPEFKKEADKKVYKYDEYQYIKIIPDNLIKN